MNRIQSEDYGIGTYEINRISLSNFDDKIYIKGYDELALSIRVKCEKSFFVKLKILF